MKKPVSRISRPDDPSAVTCLGGTVCVIRSGVRRGAVGFFLSEFRTKTSAVAPMIRMTKLVRTGPKDVTIVGMGLLPGDDDQ